MGTGQLKRFVVGAMIVTMCVLGLGVVLPSRAAAAPKETFTYECIDEDTGEVTFRRTQPIQALGGISRSIENYNQNNQQGEFCYIVEE